MGTNASGQRHNQEVRAGIDQEIWECLCDVFPCDKEFNLEAATAAVRANVMAVRHLPWDYATGRVLGALNRLETQTIDLKRYGSVTWYLPTRKERKRHVRDDATSTAV